MLKIMITRLPELLNDSWRRTTLLFGVEAPIVATDFGTNSNINR